MGAISGSRASTKPASGLGPSGFDPERIRELLAKVDAAADACPCRKTSIPYDACPKCGATSSEPCGPVVTAEGDVVSELREMLEPR